jgi:type 1 glutamine amidotransferase
MLTERNYCTLLRIESRNGGSERVLIERMKSFLHCALVGAVLLALGPASNAAPNTRVMILDGESGGPYHNWKATTPVLKKVLEDTGLFQVEVVTAPPHDGDFSGFHPKFSDYKVIVSNLDAPDGGWSDETKSAFEQYIKNGGGLVVYHAADNAFPNWQAYNLMIGVGGWRNRTEAAGPHWYYKDGKLTSDTNPGAAGRHGQRLPFQVVVRDPKHPITKGLPEKWMHAGDELYNTLKGPGKNMDVLATAYSDPANKGTGFDEPMLMALTYGKGRIFHTTMGHDVAAMASVDFITTLQRGTEWAATGKVTQKVPADFPTADKVSTRPDILQMAPPARQQGSTGR